MVSIGPVVSGDIRAVSVGVMILARVLHRLVHAWGARGRFSESFYVLIDLQRHAHKPTLPFIVAVCYQVTRGCPLVALVLAQNDHDRLGAPSGCVACDCAQSLLISWAGV
jgi:hypothetical protein